MKKILFLTPSLKRSGSEIALTNLILKSDFSAFGVYMLTFDRSGELVPLLKAKQVKVFQLWSLRSGSPASRLMGLFVRLFVDQILRIVIKIVRPDLIYTNTITLHRQVLAANKAQIPTILHTHELEQMFAGLTEQQTANLIEKPDFVIAASERAAQVFRTLGRRENMAVIPSPIDYETFQKLNSPDNIRTHAREPFTWLMAGSLDSNKNPVRFVEIARKYLSKRKHDRFVWLGGQETGYSLYAQALAKEYGIADHISWIQPKNHGDYQARFAAANGVVITSDAESLSLVAIEALAMGKPVVSFDNGGTGEILGRRHGVLVPKYDIDQCVAKMAQIANGRLKFHPQELKKRAQEFDVSRVKNQWLDILNSVAGT